MPVHPLRHCHLRGRGINYSPQAERAAHLKVPRVHQEKRQLFLCLVLCWVEVTSRIQLWVLRFHIFQLQMKPNCSVAREY